jgi:hypothetical protein
MAFAMRPTLTYCERTVQPKLFAFVVVIVSQMVHATTDNLTFQSRLLSFLVPSNDCTRTVSERCQKHF